jgi:4-carboxymuconolactone decarboxylase
LLTKSKKDKMTDATVPKENDDYARALDTAGAMLGFRLERFLVMGPGEPASGADFTRLATMQAFGNAWPRTDHLDTRSRALVSVTIAATLGVHEPLRGQLRIALNNGVTKEEIVETFIQILAYAGAARAFDSYQIAREVFEEQSEPGQTRSADERTASDFGNDE